MTNDDYTRVTNITSLMVAASAMREVMCIDGELNRDQIAEIYEPLRLLILAQRKLIEVEDH